DLSVRGNLYGRVIPDYAAVIFDEAHLLEDVASEYFGFQISNFQIAEIVRDVEMLPISDAGEYKKISKSAMRVTTVADQFWNR
ncbi:hypothetical protein OFC08_33220, partial [Escherichia coli]|nr:hypothetical protein [Escherichia coli]